MTLQEVDRDRILKLRLELVECARNNGIKEAARVFNCSLEAVKHWVELYDAEGVEGLKTHAEPPPPGDCAAAWAKRPGGGPPAPSPKRTPDVPPPAPGGKRPGDGRHQSLLGFYVELAKVIIRTIKGGSAGIYTGLSGAVKGFAGHALREQRVPAKYLLPSVLFHVALLLLLGYASTVDISMPEEKPEDFTYVDLGVEQEKPLNVYESAGEAGAAGKQAGGGAKARRGVKVSGPERAQSEASGPVEQGGDKDTGDRVGAGEKARMELEAEPGRPGGESSLMAKLDSAGKPLDTAARTRGMEQADVDLAPKGLNISASGGPGPKKSEARARSLSDKAPLGAGAAPLGQAGDTARQDSGASGGVEGGSKQSAKLGAKGSNEARGIPDMQTGKKLALDTARGRESRLSGPDAVFVRLPGMLDLKAEGAGEPGKAGPGKGKEPRSVERAGGSASAGGTAEGARSASGHGGAGPEGGAKRSGGLGRASAGGEAMPEFSSGAGKGPEMQTRPAAKRPALDGTLPGARKLDIASSGRSKGGGPSGKAAGGPSGLSEKAASAAASGALAQGAASATAAGGGYRREGGQAKGVDSGALGKAGAADKGAPGLYSGSGEKSVQVASSGGGRGRAGTTGTPDAVPGRGGGLGDLVKDIWSGVKKAGSSLTSGGGGVKLGSGEKSGGSAPKGGSAGIAGEGPGKDVPRGDKRKAAEGVLGVPGGSGQERYASAGKTKAAPIAPEKLPGIGSGSGRQGGKGFGPTVRITSPGPGTTGQITQLVSGMVSDPRSKKATLTVNDDSRVISVLGGKFEAAVALREGKNTITVMSFDPDGNVGKDSVTVVYKAPESKFAVSIAEPRNGQVFDVSKGNTVKVRGTVDDPRITRARMILNGSPKDIVVKSGRFTQEVALTQEQNTVVVEAAGLDGRTSSSRTVRFGTMNITPKDIIVVLTWDKPNADLDLHVYDPLGGHTSYKSPNVYESNEAISGGQLEQDAKGNFGPEVFTQERSARGVYTIRSNYFYSGGDGDANATVTVILFGDNPARKIVRVFGPHLQVDTRTGEETWDVARFRMPEGIFLED